MADWAAELACAAEQTHAPTGIVRITAAPGIAQGLVVPFAATLQTKLSGVQLHVMSTVRPLDMPRREADLALRLGSPAGEECVASVDFELAAMGSSMHSTGSSSNAA